MMGDMWLVLENLFELCLRLFEVCGTFGVALVSGLLQWQDVW